MTDFTSGDYVVGVYAACFNYRGASERLVQFTGADVSSTDE